MTAERRITVRPCEKRDLDHFGAFGSDLHVAYCRGEFAHAGKVILVAVSEDDVPLGKIHVHLDRAEGTVWLEAAAVAKPLQGQGIGTTLVHAAEALAAERGYRTVELGVEDRRRADCTTASATARSPATTSSTAARRCRTRA